MFAQTRTIRIRTGRRLRNRFFQADYTGAEAGDGDDKESVSSSDSEEDDSEGNDSGGDDSGGGGDDIEKQINIVRLQARSAELAKLAEISREGSGAGGWMTVPDLDIDRVIDNFESNRAKGSRSIWKKIKDRAPEDLEYMLDVGNNPQKYPNIPKELGNVLKKAVKKASEQFGSHDDSSEELKLFHSDKEAFWKAVAAHDRFAEFVRLVNMMEKSKEKERLEMIRQMVERFPELTKLTILMNFLSDQDQYHGLFEYLRTTEGEGV